MQRRWKDGELLGRITMRREILVIEEGFPKPLLIEFNIQMLFLLLRLRAFSSFPQG